MVNGLLLLLFGAELHDVKHGQGVLIEDVHAASTVVKLLNHQAQRDFVSRDSAILLRNAHQAKASVAICLGDFVGHAAVLVHFLHDVVGEVAIAELTHAFEQQLLLIGQSEIHCFLLINVDFSTNLSPSLQGAGFDMGRIRRSRPFEHGQFSYFVQKLADLRDI